MASVISARYAAARRAWGRCAGLVLLLAGAGQLALYAYTTAPGLAGTSDSYFYLYAARTLPETGHLLNPDGSPYRFWPPLYPLLLSAMGTPLGVRVLHGGCLLGALLLWSWLGRRLLPGRRAWAVPVLLALSTPWLLVSRFVWAESVFLLLFAAYAVALWRWWRAPGWGNWGVLTTVAMLLPLQRTLGVFLLVGVGAGLLLAAWRGHRLRSPWLLFAHLLVGGLAGMLWQGYALLLAGPSRYHPSLGWAQLLSSLADYGFVLSRWLLPLPAAARPLLPAAVWAAGLLGLAGLLGPRPRPATPEAAAVMASEEGAAPTAVGVAAAVASDAAAAPAALVPVLLHVLWGASAALIALVAALTVFSQSAAGLHDAERYASVLFAPVVLLVLAAWPGRAPRWLGAGLLAAWLLGAAVRVGHVVPDLRRVSPLPSGLFVGPGAHGQGVGAAGE